MIVDLSFPSGFSVNDGMPDSEAHVKFSSVDDAIDMIIRCGRGCLMAKFDIKAAHRILPIHPEDRFLFGMKWQGKNFLLTLPCFRSWVSMQNLQQFCWHSSLDLKILGVYFALNSLFGRFFPRGSPQF